jgi:hypothetical protein
MPLLLWQWFAPVAMSACIHGGTARSPEASAVMDVAFGATVNDADTPAEYLWIFFGGI